MLYAFLLIIHVVASVLLVVVVLMQASKGGGLAGLAGGMASQAVLGGRQAATLLHKVTIVLALIFGLNSLFLGVLSKNRAQLRSVTQEQMMEETANPLDFIGAEEAAPAVDEGAGTDAGSGD